MTNTLGSLVVVGVGLQLAHITIDAQQHIANADKVFYLLTDPVTESFVKDLNQTAEDLHIHYAAEKHRRTTYAEMTEHIISQVREGRRVCAVFYGHPGVFVQPSHDAIARARAEGFSARMLPAISAEDCLFADLGIDPVRGCQSYEATDFLIRPRSFDPRSILVLWQVGVIGDATWKSRYDTRNINVLVEYLEGFYESAHEVVIYEASQFAVTEPRIEKMMLSMLQHATILPISTLYVPPLRDVQTDMTMVHRLSIPV